MKYIFLFIFSFFCTRITAQTIRGNISSKNAEPMTGITIRLEDTNYATQTIENGDFILRNVIPGNYTLVASGVGYAAKKQNIVIVAGKNLFLNLQLDPASGQLNEVVVAVRKNRHRDQASAYAARMDLKNIENPQVINTVTHQLITEQGATDLNGIIKNIPGIAKGWSSVSAYYTSRGFNTRNYIRNGVSGYVTADVDMANIEQLEAIKGPSGTLFGSSLVSFGGVLNRITKKPLDTAKIEISYQGGSYDLDRFTADINTPLTKDKKILFRINAARHYEGSFQDAGFIRSTFIAPSLFYQASDKLSFSLDVEIYEREGTSQPQITPAGPGINHLGANNPSALPLDYKRSYSNNTVTLKNPAQSIYGQVNYKLSDQWSSQTNLIHTRAENTGNYLTFNLLKGDSALVRNVSQYPTSLSTITQVQQNFNGDFKIAGLRNRVVIGVEFYQNASDFSSNALNGRGGRKSFDTLNVKGAMPNYGLISPESINNKLAGLVPTYSRSQLNTYAAYVSDVLNLTGRLSAMLSLRVDRFINEGTTNVSTNLTTGNYSQTAFSPKVGLVYQLVKDRISVFGNYTNGFQNVAPVTQPDGTVSTFKPKFANQLEGGIKAELAGDFLTATLSYYDISVKNILRTEVDRPTFSIQEGTQYSKGVEVDLFSRPVKGLLLNAGFAYNDSQLTSADATVTGLRPVNSGPSRTGNFYASYTLPYSALKGLGLGFGGNFYSRNYIINNTTAGQFYLNGYTLLNAAVFYSKARYRFGLNAENLTNTKFYNGGFGTITPGGLRRFVASLTVKF
nr:TonB-dependent receptor [uncultured Pedobacter sp.]